MNIKTIYSWLVYSSANADKLSATIKGIGGTVVSYLALLSLLHINVDANSVTSLFETAALFVSQAGIVIGTGVSLAGVVRKIWLTLKGDNQVLKGLGY